MTKLFISYRRVNAAFTGRIYDRLRARFREDNIFKDHNIPPGKDFRKILADEVQACDVVVVVIGRGWADLEDEGGHRRLDNPRDFVRTEIELALERDIPVIPLLLEDAQMPGESDLPDSIDTLAYRQAARVRADPDFDHDIERLCAAIDTAGEDPSVESKVSAVCPYRGLEAFRIDDADMYFGREDAVDLALKKIGDFSSPDAFRFLAIIGASGSGKSSLSYAGILARLTHGTTSKWPIVVCRPGHHAVEQLAIALGNPASSTARAAGDVGELRDKLKEDESRLHLVSRLALEGRPEDERLVLLVDQFEELFRPGDPNTKQAFIDNLLYAAKALDGKTIVLLTMRADFYAKASVYPKLAAALATNQVLVGPMSDEQVRAAIEKPAHLAGARLETGLVDLIIQDMKSEPGALPFLQDALTQLWERQNDGLLTVADYKQIGRLEGAIENRANAFFDSLNDEEQEACRRIFLRLTQPGEGTEDTKRRVRRSNLGDSDEIQRFIQKLARARLITTESENETAYVEVSHEALIRGWSRLRAWIDADRDALRLQHQISADATSWHENRDDAFLYRGSRLGIAVEWLSTHRDALAPNESEFLDASHALEESQKDARRRASVRLRRLAVAAVGAAVIAIVLAVVATSSYFEARTSAENARNSLLNERTSAKHAHISLANARRSKKYAIESLMEAAVSEQYARNSLLKANEARIALDHSELITESQTRVARSQSLALKARDLLRIDADGAVRKSAEALTATLDFDQVPPEAAIESLVESLKQRSDNYELLALADIGAQTGKALLSKDDRWLIVHAPDSQLHLWDLERDKPERITLHGHEGGIRDVFVTEQWLVTHGAAFDVRIWDLRTKDPSRESTVLANGNLSVRSLVVSPDDQWLLATRYDSDPRLWNLTAANPLESAVDVSVADGVNQASFGPNGDWLALVGSRSPFVSLWRLSDVVIDVPMGSLEPLGLSRRAPKVVEFTQDGRWLSVREHSEGTVQISSDMSSRSTPFADTPRYEAPRTFRASRTPALGIWDLSTITSEKSEFDRPTKTIRLDGSKDWQGVSYVHNVGTDRLLTFDGHSTSLWSLSDNEKLIATFENQAPVRLSASHRWLATHNGMALGLCDLADEEIGSVSVRVLDSLERPSTDVHFSNNDEWLVSRSVRGNIRLWSMGATQQVSIDLWQHEDGIQTLKMSPNGRWLVGESEQMLRLWDLTEPGRAPRELNAHPTQKAKVQTVVFARHTAHLITCDGWLAFNYECEGNGTRSFKAYPRVDSLVDYGSEHRHIAIARGNSFDVWHLGSPDVKRIGKRTFNARIKRLSISADAKWIAVALDDHRVFVCETSNLSDATERKLVKHTDEVSNLVFLNDSDSLLTTSFDGTTLRCSLTSDAVTEEISSVAHGICFLSISPNSQWCVLRGFGRSSQLAPLSSEESAMIRTWSGYISDEELASPLTARSLDRYSNDTLVKRIWNEGTDRIRSRASEADEALTKRLGMSAAYLESVRKSAVEQGVSLPDVLNNLMRRKQREPPPVAADDKRVVSNGYKASWFPDNKRIAYGRTGGGIVVKDLSTGEAKVISERGKDPAVSPNGKRIAVVHKLIFGDYGSETIWLMNSDGSNVVKLDEGTFPVWSKDGIHIFYCSRTDHVVYKMDVDDPSNRSVFFDAPAREYFAVSPDETRIAFGGVDGWFRVINVDNRTIEDAFWLPQRGYLPAWSPDASNEMIAFGGYNGSLTGLLAYNLKEHNFRLVSAGESTLPSFSPDGTKMAFDFRPSEAGRVTGGAIHVTSTEDVWKAKAFPPLFDLFAGDLLSVNEEVQYLPMSIFAGFASQTEDDWTTWDNDDQSFSPRKSSYRTKGQPEPIYEAIGRVSSDLNSRIRRVRMRVRFRVEDVSEVEHPLLTFLAKGHVKVYLNSRLLLEVGDESANAENWFHLHVLNAHDLQEGDNVLAFEINSTYSSGDIIKLFNCSITDSSHDQLERIYKSEDYPIGLRRAAMTAFADSSTKEVSSREALLDVLKTDDDELRRDAVRALCSLPLDASDIYPVLLDLLKSRRNAGIRGQILDGLGDLGAPAMAATPVLQKMLVRGHADVVVPILRIAPESVDDVVRLLDEENAPKAEERLFDTANRIVTRAGSTSEELKYALKAANAAKSINNVTFSRWLKDEYRYLRQAVETSAVSEYAARGEWHQILRFPFQRLLRTISPSRSRGRPRSHTSYEIDFLLGLASYRLDLFDESISHVKQALAYSDGRPIDFALLAMAFHKSGDAVQTQENLSTSRRLLALDRWKSDEYAKAFVAEAERLVAGDSSESVSAEETPPTEPPAG